MMSDRVSRRLFLKQASLAAAFVPVLDLGFVSCTYQAKPASTSEGEVPWRITTVKPDEPGESLIVSGTIYSPDGRTPLEGVNLYVYQTDATGHYSTTGGNNRLTRIHGLMRTDARGRYEFRTVKPTPYPNGREPAHIHAYVSGPGYPEYWIDEYLFDDDRFIKEEQRSRNATLGSFSPILKLQRGADGVLRGARDIRIERCTNNCTGT